MTEKRYRVVSDSYGSPGNRRERGEIFEPDDDELRAFGDKLQPVEVDEDNGEVVEPDDVNDEFTDTAGETDENSETTAPFDVSDQSVDDLEDRLDNNEFSDEELNALIEDEKTGKDRSTAIDAINNRR